MQQNLHNRSEAGSQSDPVMEPVKEMAGQAGQEAMKVAEQARHQGVSMLSKQKDQASEALRATSKAVEEMGHRLEQEGQGTVAQFATMAAQQVNQFSEFLGSRDIEDLFRELERTARRQPAYFLGGAFVLGLLGARFLKSSQSHHTEGRMGSWGGQQHWSGSHQPWQSSWQGSQEGTQGSGTTHRSEQGQSRSGSFLDEGNEPTGSFETPRSWQGQQSETRTPAASGSTQERHGRLDPPQSNGRSQTGDH